MRTINIDEYVNFGDVARQQLGIQCQYASSYLYPNNDSFLGDGIRFMWGIEGDYHSITIHKDDVEEFVRRVKSFRNGGQKPTSKWADYAHRLLREAKKCRSYSEAGVLHEEMNIVLGKLRCGCRRGSYRMVREKLRESRTMLCHKFSFPKSG